MIVVKTVKELEEALAPVWQKGLSVGFVPTMGALHEGHISLVSQSVADNEASVVSIFVNPTQFNDKNDLAKYPRTLEADLQLLAPAGTDVVFAPGVEDIYPEEDLRQFDFGTIGEVMEGRHRPGHFNGVAQVVSRLFELVKPTRAYFGQKDFQQLAVIRAMVAQLRLSVQVVGMPIVREGNGLAMSSRNERLSAAQRELASNISKALVKSRNFARSKSVGEVEEYVIREVNSHEGLRVEYFEIVDGRALNQIGDWAETDYAVGCIAVFCGEVRLIDNITYFEQGQFSDN